MKQSLLSGKTLVVDRYAYSGVAYTVAKVRVYKISRNNAYINSR